VHNSVSITADRNAVIRCRHYLLIAYFIALSFPPSSASIFHITLMRVSFPNILRTFYTLNSTSRLLPAFNTTTALQPFNLTAARIAINPSMNFISSFFTSTPRRDEMSFPVQKNKEEWQAVLNKEQFRVLRQQGTEAPGSGKYDKHMPQTGTYNCAGCDAPLYTAKHKFKSGCGWPAFFDAIPGAVGRNVDNTFGMGRLT
jgi:peptide-methionine (R)-S-oxide reductase